MPLFLSVWTIDGAKWTMKQLKDYVAFNGKKSEQSRLYGFEVDPSTFHPSTYPHQADVAAFALKTGRGLIAMSFGLGKTHVQLLKAKAIHEHTGKRFLIVCPLGVKHQFSEEDGPRMGMDVRYVTCDADILAAPTPYLVTNYERIREGNISPAVLATLGGVSLDEGSVLRSLDSKTWDIFTDVFEPVPYRFVNTATPSPNNYIELINYAVWLGIADRGYLLTRWFQRDSTKAGNLTLHPHTEDQFWLWVSTWAVFLYAPSDLGYSDEGYELPGIKIHWHRIGVDHRRAWGQADNRGQLRLFLDAGGGVREASTEKRETLAERLQAAKAILAEDEESHWLLWHHLESERQSIEAEIPEAVTVYGSQDLDVREQRILDFSHGKIRILATKPQIAGSGCNFQRHCHKAVYLGLDYKFEDFIQSVHRILRFQQTELVEIHIIYAESEDAVVNAMRHKWRQHDRLVAKMRRIVQKFGLSHSQIDRQLKRRVGVRRKEELGMARWRAVNNDNVQELTEHGDADSVGLIFTSIPFGNHYEYTDQVEDFGHNKDNGQFWKQMDWLIPQLYRVLIPGRVAAIHVKDRILYGHQTASGFMEIAPFSDECVAAFRKHGFLYQGRRTLVKDVVAENNQTYRLGYSEMLKDASKMGSGLPEYILLFRKPPSDSGNHYSDLPVVKERDDYSIARWQIDAHQFWRSNGNALISQDLAHYDFEAHVARLEYADSKGNLARTYFMEPPASNHEMVWTDLNYMRCLNAAQSRRRVEQHICPLPLDICERIVKLYSNMGDVVLDPFGGLMSVPYTAIRLGRYGYGIELNPAYFRDGIQYLADAERDVLAPSLFDLVAVA